MKRVDGLLRSLEMCRVKSRFCINAYFGLIYHIIFIS